LEEIKIRDLAPGVVAGIQVQMPSELPGCREAYFEWTASSLTSTFNSTKVSGGILRAWRHVPVFHELETHIDAEMFYFVSGVALMFFIDINEGGPDLKTARIVRIQPGTQIIISAGKGHFVPVAADSEPVYAVVVSPEMDAPRMTLPEIVVGI
jgi:mannose-6-phosphate isomerase-like protein (cupin superfamily)